VPSAAQVIPGAGVSIILKIDQPTGRQVQGIIAEVLGRGEHPRGIKVRLVDGRVGRVQAMVSEDVATEASRGLEGLGRNGEIGDASSGPSSYGPRVTTARFVSTDFRDDGYDYESAEGAREAPNLMDYVKTTKSKGSKKGTRQPALSADGDVKRTSEEPADTSKVAETIRCPVCDAFEGDKQAVEFHVNEHFA
jgi:uncharacterized repeat protein (TIGR03833 family)